MHLSKASQAHLASDGSLAAAAVAVRSQLLGRMLAQLGRQGGCSSLIRLLPLPMLSTPLNPPVTAPGWLGPVPRMHHHLCRQVTRPFVAQEHQHPFVLCHVMLCHAISSKPYDAMPCLDCASDLTAGEQLAVRPSTTNAGRYKAALVAAHMLSQREIAMTFQRLNTTMASTWPHV